jgi:CHAD domain-containing protein
LRQFRDLYAPQWADSLRADVKGLSDRLGAVRDADVLLARLQERVVALPMEDRPHGQTLVDNLARSRAAHGERLIALMCSPRYEQLLEAMHGAVREPQLTDPCELGAAEVLLPFARRTWRRLRGAVEDLGPQPGDRELPRVRIAGKRARYAANVLGPVVGKPAERFAGSAAELQDRLGDHQDAVVAQAWLRRTASDATQAEALVAGELVAAERSAAAEARATWPRAWEKLDRSRNTGWMGP